MRRHLVLRILLARLPVLAAAVVFTFVLVRVLPGDPAAGLAVGPGAGPEEVAALHARLGLDRGLGAQFASYAAGLARGDLGRSFISGAPVTQDLRQRLPASLELVGVALALALAVAVPLGMAAARAPGGAWDRACRLVAATGVAVPTFVIGLGLILVFYRLLGVVPMPVGRLDPLLAAPPLRSGFLLLDAALAGDAAAWRSAAAHLVLPCATLALFAMGPLAGIARTAVAEAWAADPVRTARALGLPPRLVWRHYAMAPAMAPILTAASLVFSAMLGADVLVEILFAWPGIGVYAVAGLLGSDYPAVQGFILVVAALFVLVNLGTDLLSAWVDPRVGRVA